MNEKEQLNQILETLVSIRKSMNTLVLMFSALLAALAFLVAFYL
jgi:hypothetical protein